MLTPLHGFRVVNIGRHWAGRVASLLLAEQGADVIELVCPGSRDKPQPFDILLDRGKRLTYVDFKASGALDATKALIDDADLCIENMRPGAAVKLGLDHASLAMREARAHGRALVSLSLPGFAEGDPRRSQPAWEGTINAASGVFTDVLATHQLLGGAPLFTAIPMASAYGGTLGALAASLALHHRQSHGVGQCVEVPLADATMFAMGWLMLEVEGQPERYNYPSLSDEMLHGAFPIFRELRQSIGAEQEANLMRHLREPPGITFYKAADGRTLFVCVNDHVHGFRAMLQTFGVVEPLLDQGFIFGSPFSECKAGINLLNHFSLSPLRRRAVLDTIAAAVATRPASEWAEALNAAGVPSCVVQTIDEWFADPKLRASGVTVEAPGSGKVVPGRFLDVRGSTTASPPLRAAAWCDTSGVCTPKWRDPPVPSPSPPAQDCSIDATCGMLHGIKVLDLSNIIAGPSTGRLLAEHGADVVQILPPVSWPPPLHALHFGLDVNQGKRSVILDLKCASGAAAFARLVQQADVVLHNILDAPAARLGLEHQQLARINPKIITCQLSAFGGPEDDASRQLPGYDPVAQAAAGIMARFSSLENPKMHALASCADYITGILAAQGIVAGLLVRQRDGASVAVHTSLAMGVQLVQFPFATSQQLRNEPSGLQALGESTEQHLYSTADGTWCFVGCRPGDAELLALKLGAAGSDVQSLSAIIAELALPEVQERLRGLAGASAVAVMSLRQIRAVRTESMPCSSRTEEAAQSAGGHTSLGFQPAPQPASVVSPGSFRLRRDANHPCGYPVTAPMPTWIQPAAAAVSSLTPPHAPGTHTREVLFEAGFSFEEVTEMLACSAAYDAWDDLKMLPPGQYLPR
mmetsp:Transcript_41143/g.68400  ORF Transcript_41143/g.68400 Transcript_41143/m.68400 type:complete len:866 (-) Transcript_41143:105-2702(-)|eukprot:CAMPEP_0119319656 /NCGR_PEP_ID=MMETSP1333-20130426/49997_1 /TAXON_ID=418940 /ORGANISM="Scyphosphaera apsteinii, Strain RCC1455" /LENGTH=865 /DNA_ID=CAMNT_0007326125 /DNA_START=111 /DNA_END=2708 /DNA_ORIENTATION=+